MLDSYKQHKRTADKLHKQKYTWTIVPDDGKKVDYNANSQKSSLVDNNFKYSARPGTTKNIALKNFNSVTEVEYNPISRKEGSLKVSDIEGARPKAFGSNHYYKPIDAIEGASPKKLHGRYKVPDFKLDVEDIKGAQADTIKFRTDRRIVNPTNPVDPKYKLPSGPAEEPYPEPKFIRDTMYHDDIPKSSPKHYKLYDDRFYHEKYQVD